MVNIFFFVCPHVVDIAVMPFFLFISQDIPSSGVDRWFPLEGRSHRSTIQGQIRLKLSLGTREDRGMAASIDDNWKEVVEHQELLWIFIEHELRNLECPSYEWAGDLPAPALTILQQHAIQGDITELQQAICRWVMYSRKHMGVSLDYALLLQLLDDLDRAWEDSDRPLSRDEEACLAESFNVFIDYCLELLQKHRDLFPMTHVEAEHKLVHLLKCLALIYRMKAFQWCCPFRNQLSVEITNTLKKGCADWFRCTHALHQPLVLTEQTVLASLTELTNALNADLHKGIKHYNRVFET